VRVRPPVETKASPALCRRLPGTSENDAQKQKRYTSYPNVANDSDIADIHVRKWHTDQSRETEDAADNQQKPQRSLQPAPLNTGAAKSIERAKKKSHASMSSV
jgi:hypothetical protein